MATAAAENPYEVTATWAANGGPFDDEKTFQDKVKEIGVRAIQSDDAFGRVWHRFADMAMRYGRDFPDLTTHNAEWIGYRRRWASHLSLSRDATNEHIAFFKRIDKVYLDMEGIQTDQDLQNVIAGLQKLTEEKHDTSEEMSQGSLALQKDIYDFEKKLDRFAEGIENQPDARELRDAIDNLQSEISKLDEKIKATAIALGITGSLLIPGAVIAGSVLAAYQIERNGKAKELTEKERGLADANHKQEALGNLKADLVGVKADIDIIRPTTTLELTQIPSEIQGQNEQFKRYLKGGLDSLRGKRFKREIQIAREICASIQARLVWYAQELQNRI